MNKIYLVIIDYFENEENSIVDICTTRELAEELMNKYIQNSSERDLDAYDYHIDEVELDASKGVLWDCYENSTFNIRENGTEL